MESQLKTTNLLPPMETQLKTTDLGDVGKTPPATTTTDEVRPATTEQVPATTQTTNSADKKAEKCVEKKAKAKKQKKSKVKAKFKTETADDDSDSSATHRSTPSLASTSESDDSDSDDGVKKHRRSKKRHNPSKSRAKKSGRPNKKSSDDSSDSSSTDDPVSDEDDDEDDDEGDVDNNNNNNSGPLRRQLGALQAQLQAFQMQNGSGYAYPNQFNNAPVPGGLPGFAQPPINNLPAQMRQLLGNPRRHMPPPQMHQDPHRGNLAGRRKDRRRRRGKVMKLDFKRVDQVWDNTIHQYKLQDTAERSDDSQYDEFLFNVRRTFDWEGKYKSTVVDIKSKLLREALQEVMGSIRGVSLVEQTPRLDPNLLFLYLDDMCRHCKALKKAKPPKGAEKRERKKAEKRILETRQHLKVLIKYLQTDYAEIKSSLDPMLANGLITYDLLWALWKPSTLAYTTTYGSHDQPRVFKVESAEKHRTIMGEEFYFIEGKYFEYDGKQFGYGTMAEQVQGFRGAKKITSLSCYPLQYHKNEAELRKTLIERGKKFVSLHGVHYKAFHGMAYFKKKKSAIVKVNINGRVMVDPAIHRRIHPNYLSSVVRPKDHDISDDDSDDGGHGCGGHSSDSDSDKPARKLVIIRNKDGKPTMMSASKAKQSAAKLDHLPEGKDGVVEEGDEKKGDASPADADRDEKKTPEFSDEEYLIASPVVLGFAFAEKMWLEFAVSCIEEIKWNETAYDSLVLEKEMKGVVKALVESHKYHAASSIDDVIQGKGRGLVAVLHGPPGTGKTLTAEGISELLKCPLYMVSAGELGTDSRYLEAELQKILDICHAWGAILLLDEADVFLEKRNMHDIHRNALVSIFLRQLEYFQGILFLTTNRVETFDEAFQSRIHVGLRYDNLDMRAKRSIFKIFVERVQAMEKDKAIPFAEKDLDDLARFDLNGRQIKNTVRTAQAIAVNKGESLTAEHIRSVLKVQMKFQNDLSGGPGYKEAMRSYF